MGSSVPLGSRRGQADKLLLQSQALGHWALWKTGSIQLLIGREVEQWKKRDTLRLNWPPFEVVKR